MYAKWVTVNLGDLIDCKVWVTCTPSTPEDELQCKAMEILMNRLPTPTKKSDMEVYADALQKIDAYQYSQGRGARYELEQALMKMSEEKEERLLRNMKK